MKCGCVTDSEAEESEEEIAHDEDAVGLSYVGETIYEKLRTKHASTHNECWNVTNGKVIGEVRQTPPAYFWKSVVPAEKHSDFFPDSMYDTIVKAQYWVDITSLSPPDGRFLEKFRDAVTVLARRADDMGEPIVVRMLFGNIVGMPVDCNAVIEALTENVSEDTRLQLWVGAWRKGLSWNHSKIIAVDGKHLYNGGHNLWDGHYLKINPVHDVSMQAEGEIAHDGHVFANKMWEYIERTQGTLIGQMEAALPDWLPLVQNFRVAVSQFPEELDEFPPMYVHQPVPFNASAIARNGCIPMISMGRYGTLHQWGGIWANKANPSDSAIIAAFASAKTIIKMSLQDLGPLCLPFQFGSETPTSIPGGCWPDAYLRELAIAIYEREVDVEIALSHPHCVPGNLNPNTANYGNGWSCVDVASEIIKAVLKQYPHANHPYLRKMVLDNLRLCYVSSPNAGGIDLGNHAKFWIIDDRAYYIGSQNLYVCNLAEWGVLVDDQKATEKLLEEYWKPMWSASYVESKDANVDEVMDSLNVDRTGVSPLEASIEMKLEALKAHRKSCQIALAEHHEHDLSEITKHFVVEDDHAEHFRIH